LGERFLRYSWQQALWLVLLAIAREQQQGAGQSFFARVEEVIHEVCLEAGVPQQHVCNESIRERMLAVQQANHLLFGNDEHRARYRGGRGLQADRVAGKSRLAQKLLIQMKAETLARVDEALARLDAGQYGRCFECGGEIAEKRLRALPFAERCTVCEEKKEQLQGRARQSAQSRAHLSLFSDVAGS
jgi:RNA polymerase-binding transcription factor DksA